MLFNFCFKAQAPLLPCLHIFIIKDLKYKKYHIIAVFCKLLQTGNNGSIQAQKSELRAYALH